LNHRYISSNITVIQEATMRTTMPSVPEKPGIAFDVQQPLQVPPATAAFAPDR
jgi:hypothetical protein